MSLSRSVRVRLLQEVSITALQGIQGVVQLHPELSSEAVEGMVGAVVRAYQLHCARLTGEASERELLLAKLQPNLAVIEGLATILSKKAA